jgi:iron(III) transport system substrate-binding protein
MAGDSVERPGDAARGRRRPGPFALAAVVLLALAACGGTTTAAQSSKPAATTLTLYTCVSDTTIQPVIAAFEKSRRGSTVKLFRAPTGQLNARIAADLRSGGLRADVVWACDPLTMQALVGQHLVGGWTPPEARAIPAAYRTADYVGAHLLYMVAVHRTGVPAPHAWADLTGPRYARSAVPDPGVAASALGALGWFASRPDYGVAFYRALRRNGAVQVSTPDDVTTGVAQGVYDAGITTATSGYAAKDAGSPVDVAWPQPGAVAIYGPVALATRSRGSQVAKAFLSFVVGAAGQRVVGASGSYPTRPGIAGPTVPAGAPVVSPDWASIGKNRDTVLADYRKVFGG